MDASSYGLAGEMSIGFSIDPNSGVVSTLGQLAVGRYEFIIVITLSRDPHIFLFVGLVDVLSSSKCPRDIVYIANTYMHIMG